MVASEQLLRRYADEKCDDAFAELVTRHIDLVYGAALRQVHGDTGLARDIVQNVFTDLARKAGRVSTPVAGWLYRHTRLRPLRQCEPNPVAARENGRPSL